MTRRCLAVLLAVTACAWAVRLDAQSPVPSPVPSATPAPAVASPSPSASPLAPPSPTTGRTSDSDYRVGPGDVVEVNVLGHNDLSRTATVQPNGTVTLPLLNEVQIAGLTVSEVQRKLTTLLNKDFLVDPHVEVKVTEYQSQFVIVVGEVNSPGRKALRGGSRLVDVLVDSGGFTAHASGEVVINRAEGTFEGGAKVLRVRLGGAFSAQDYVTLEIGLRQGDVVTALARSYVTVEGEVQHPGRYAIEGELTVTGALSTAGGMTRYGSSQVRLRRIDPASGKVTITKVDLKDVSKGKQADPVVMSNDVITVPRRLF